MASSYPGAYDTFASPGTNLSSSPTHSSQHQLEGDAIEAIQAELGLNPSGSSATVAARLDGGLGTVGQWLAWAPALKSGATTITYTNTYGRYYKAGRHVDAQGFFTVTGGGDDFARFGFDLPVAAALSAGGIIGRAYYNDISTGNVYRGDVILSDSGTRAYILDSNVAATSLATPGAGDLGLGANTFNAFPAAGDLISVFLTYESAS